MGCGGRIRLPNAKFAIYDNNWNQICIAQTNCNGEICFDNLAYGKYYIKELEAPYGYEKDDCYYEVCICANQEHKIIELYNKKNSGSIKIIKYGHV